MAKTFNTIKTESSTNVWLTPRNVLDLLGDFDTDPCAATIRPWDCARVNYTVEDNGLILPWKGRVWLNPPYGNEIEPFLKRMSEHIGGGGLALIFMRSDTRWFHQWVLNKAKYLFLWKGRIKFCYPDGKSGGTSNAPSVLVAWEESEASLLYSLQDQGYGKIASL